MSRTNPVKVRKHSRVRRERAYALRDKLYVQVVKLGEQLRPDRWETVGSGRKAQRRRIPNPANEAIYRRIFDLEQRRSALARMGAEIADLGPLKDRRKNNNSGTPKWPGDHSARHAAAAKRGWLTRRAHGLASANGSTKRRR